MLFTIFKTFFHQRLVATKCEVDFLKTKQNLIINKIDLRLVQKYEPMNHKTCDMSRLMRKPTICICENKDADQLRGNREADQRLCFRYSDSTIPPLLNSKILSI